MTRQAKTILCIDDHQNALAGWSLLLHNVGYRVLSAADPSEGLQLFGTSHVDAVVLDYQMPEMDGARVAAAMKQMKPAVPVVMFTAHSLPRELEQRVDGVIVKGRPPQVLISKLDELLGVGA